MEINGVGQVNWTVYGRPYFIPESNGFQAEKVKKKRSRTPIDYLYLYKKKEYEEIGRVKEFKATTNFSSGPNSFGRCKGMWLFIEFVDKENQRIVKPSQEEA